MEKVMSLGRRLLSVLVVLLLVTAGRPAAADDNIEEAARHFERGLQLYSEGAFEAALVEFERAYQIAPSYKILYNQARIHRAMNQYAEALVKFERYLREGGADIAEARRDEVKQEIQALRPRVATIEVKTNIQGADVFVDDIPLGQSPIPRAIIVNPGMRKITASKRGYLPATRAVRVVGSDAIAVSLELVSLTTSKPVETPVDTGPRNRAIVGWAATGALTTGAIISGVLALNASSDLDAAKTVPNQDPEVLQSENDRLRTLSVVADVFTGTALLAGGFSIYLTVKAVQSPEKPNGAGVTVGIGPSNVLVTGRF